ncbi:hypothetical protein PF005_g12286 [Phytophthora fragariae]|uniref:Dynein heavy chain region D6 P-loop domain-containing protein n=1 Tax=Phytophthora fragariae TaxID=53985 RepID=A0A6A3TJ46_9STRA|nr:hypothetical protein PF003_g2727 [Phytophthora fragariae]KAE8936690.1 hypothetical protein PF009_g13394 [Phytophthora fragariae]KAE9007274.1 hypothetical protein PF011_g11202 [Phytophthora fragariae]KAE9135114.1 hypothetical protein PF006_g14679 [Phytophthora fragariae]KAE9208253.1 hypothetical protein PF005_g12286 [Phytophthora fragariae]
MVAEVDLLLFSNAANQEGWSKVRPRSKFHSYMASMSIISGATKGETCPPLSPIDGNATNLSNKVSLLEGSIVIWTKQGRGSAVVKKEQPELEARKQELVPFVMDRLEVAHRNGHWVILNNIHLMPRWLLALEKKLDKFALEGSHKNFRLFLTSDPSYSIPIGANLKRVFVSFPKKYIEEAEDKVKSNLFGLCHFHAVLMEGKMYGPMGINTTYPFSLGDLRDSALSVCRTTSRARQAARSPGPGPWADLR